VTTPLLPSPDLIDQIPDPDTVRAWLAEANRRSDLLRSLLRVARRKAAYDRPSGADSERREAKPCPA
jgi:hypothetical protein